MAALSGLRARDALWFGAGWIVATAAVHLLRRLPWTLSAIVGAACAALLVASLRTGRSLRRAARDSDPG